MLRAMEKAEHDSKMPINCCLPDQKKLQNFINILRKEDAAKSISVNVQPNPASMDEFCAHHKQVPNDPVAAYVADSKITPRGDHVDFYMAITSSTLVNFVPKGKICSYIYIYIYYMYIYYIYIYLYIYIYIFFFLRCDRVDAQR